MSKHTFDRFDLESAIQNCWSITDDLKSCDDEYVKALTVVYDRKFELLWKVFETMVTENQIIYHNEFTEDLPYFLKKQAE